MAQITKEEKAFIHSHKVARLATVDETGKPLVVPICYVYDGEFLFSSIDAKPKRVPANKLKRIRNINSNPKVSLVVDEYDDDWSRLCYVIINGTAEILDKGKDHEDAVTLLKQKYPQYASMPIETLPIIKIKPTSIISWGNLAAYAGQANHKRDSAN